MKLQGKKTGAVANFVGYIDQATPTIDLPTGNTMLTVRYMDAGVNCYKDYKTIAEFNADWEDYKPIEPLIKDEKIRKAVKAWAEANDIKKIIVFDCGNNAPHTPVGAVDFAENGSHLEIRFRTEERFDTDRIYTIVELCGEENGE